MISLKWSSICFKECSLALIEIDPLLFYDQRPFENLSMDGADIFSDDPDEKELHGGKEKEPDHKGCNAYVETIPKDEFVNKITQGHKQTENGDSKTCHCR